MNSVAIQLENMVRDYVAGKVDWGTVHQFAVQMEYEGKTDFPIEFRRALEELHMIFLADAADDAQFRADRKEIEAALVALEKLKADVSTMGREAVARRELAQENEQHQAARQKFLARRRAK
jgi:hypothetical protein